MNNTTNKIEKSRTIGVYQFFEILQLEWICCDLRTKIYKREIDKNYWKKTCEGKKIKILNIAERNKLPTIFTDEDMFQVLKAKIFKEQSYPNFIYSSDKQRETQNEWDIYYYYYKGTDVRFEYYGESKVGVVNLFHADLKTVNISIKTTGDPITIELPISEVTRII